jgi:hypothetical protein
MAGRVPVFPSWRLVPYRAAAALSRHPIPLGVNSGTACHAGSYDSFVPNPRRVMIDLRLSVVAFGIVSGAGCMTPSSFPVVVRQLVRQPTLAGGPPLVQ